MVNGVRIAVIFTIALFIAGCGSWEVNLSDLRQRSAKETGDGLRSAGLKVSMRSAYVGSQSNLSDKGCVVIDQEPKTGTPLNKGSSITLEVDCIASDAVAKAGHISIRKQTYNHWFEIAAKSQQQAQPDKKKKKKKENPIPKKGSQEYKQLRDQVMEFLINAAWIKQEAADRGIKVSKKDIDKEFEKTKKQFFSKKKDFDKFLKNSGMSLDDVKLRVKLQLLSNKIREKLTKDASKVSDEEIDKYYKKNKKQFTTTLNKATRNQIKGILKSQGQQEALEKFIEDFREEWKSQTECRKGYVIKECANSQKSKTKPNLTSPLGNN